MVEQLAGYKAESRRYRKRLHELEGRAAAFDLTRRNVERLELESANQRNRIGELHDQVATQRIRAEEAVAAKQRLSAEVNGLQATNDQQAARITELNASAETMKITIKRYKQKVWILMGFFPTNDSLFPR